VTKTKTATKFGNLYLGNKMVGKPYFNAPWFDATADRLRAIPGVDGVFNPAEEDRRTGFEPMSCPLGTTDEARRAGFDRRRALGADWLWIACYSNGLIVGPDWETSTGTISEVAAHQALNLPVWEAYVFFRRIEVGKADWLVDPAWQIAQLKDLL
jgi:hypothetical protein